MPSWDSLEPGVHGPRGRRVTAVSESRRVLNTPHEAGSKHGGMGDVCAHGPDDVRTRGQEFPGAVALALSTLWLTTLAKMQGGASQRPSVLAGPMFVCCCIGQAKVNGATNRTIRHATSFFGDGVARPVRVVFGASLQKQMHLHLLRMYLDQTAPTTTPTPSRERWPCSRNRILLARAACKQCVGRLSHLGVSVSTVTGS